MASNTSSPPVDRQADAVADVQAGVATGLLDGADEVARQALGGQLGRHRRVEHDEAAAGQHRGGARPRPPSPSTTVSSAYSPSTSASPPAVTVPSSSTDQSPDLLPLMARLHVAAQPRAGRAGVDGEPLA